MTYLTEYNPDWPAWFAQIEQYLRPRLPTDFHIEHIGSTSIPNMPAKPIIDIDIVVPNGAMPAAIAAIEQAGYAHQGDQGIPTREAFKQSLPATEALPHHHLYACELSSPELLKHLAFRDYLRAHPAEAERLATLKRHLAFTQNLPRPAYIEAKSPLVTTLSQTALIWRSKK